MFDWIFKRKEREEAKKLAEEMKYVTTITYSQRIHKELPFIDDNFLYTNSIIYTLLENENGKRTYKFVSTHREMNSSATRTAIYGSIIVPWLHGAELPKEYYNWTNGSIKSPKLKKTKPKTGPVLVNFDEEKEKREKDR